MQRARIDIKIMAVESRKEHADSVLKEVMDNNTSKIIYDDKGINGGGNPWYNAKRCWLTDTDADYQMVIQDDAILCTDFLEYVYKCIAFNPMAIWSFYCPYKVTKKITKIDASTPYLQIVGNKLNGATILLPKKYARTIVEDTDYIFGEEYKHDDSRISWWSCYNKIPAFTTNPALVEQKTIKSTLAGHRGKGNSRFWIGKDVSKADWESKKYNKTPFVFPDLWMNEENANYRKAYEYCQMAKRRAKEEWK